MSLFPPASDKGEADEAKGEVWPPDLLEVEQGNSN